MFRIGWILIGIGLAGSLAVIILGQVDIASANRCIHQAVVGQPCYFLGGFFYGLNMLIFTLGLPIAGISLVLLGMRRN